MKDAFEPLVGQNLLVLSSILEEHLESHGGIVHPSIARGILLCDYLHLYIVESS